ncbi:SARP family transcriptional regulator [Gordonibacter sp. 28C]|uniref:BTAD domain-containing putative transcriptional regulator n=1 Tax=Gordonibacter sp. 28C TaxID=2078569 RepID=UPI000DF84C5B|nr:BTAD domain-containing putative transcriptional regulator [Gordonibacter sp. 28C]RDB60486.1 SARP family transcriptional regulator [Gordonibacter sp. 28C]
MTGFLEQSACKGRRPNHLASRRHYPRPDLIARLLRERHVARFLVAPEGFGKSGLAMEYSDTVFSFEHVFWINGRSPCFLRDLDRDIIVSSLTAADEGPFLVVMEDVPPLDAARAASLSAAFDELLGRGCEVLATCAPSCDAYGPLQHDRLKLSAVDLLLSDVEVDVGRSSDDRAARPASAVPPAERIPALVWGPPGAEAAFLGGILREELPADVLLAMATMLVLGMGSVLDVDAFGPCGDDLVALLASSYPYLGVDRRRERFEAPDFPASAVAGAIAGKVDALAVRSRFAGRDALVGRWADALVDRARCERACELVGALCSRAARAAWLAERSRALMRRACVLPGHELYASLGQTASLASPRLELGEAVRLAVLGDVSGALGLARRVAFDLSAPDGVRALAALLVVRRGKGPSRKRAHEELARLAGSHGGGDAASSMGRDAGRSPDAAFWSPLVSAQLALLDDPSWLAHGAASRMEDGDGDARALAAAWALDEVAEGREGARSDEAPERAEALARMEAFVRARLAEAGEEGRDLFAAAAGLALERVRERGGLDSSAPLGADEALVLHRTEMELFSQRRSFERASREREERRAERAAARPDAYLDGRYLPEKGRATTIVPLLTVNLFGGLDVRIGDAPVDPRRFRRQKVKTLLALLVLNRGREFPRDRLVRILWPESEMDTARKNFYSIWSYLRSALSGPSGTCPYLVRQQNGCRLDERLLNTDVARFDAVCRMLLFGQPSADGWAQLYAEIDDAFADDLMPSEQDNEFVVQARSECRVQLVDALVAAADRLVAAHDVQEGLWFARAALRRDRTREDAYTALMRAQIAAGQRTAALETYFSCRRFLTTELGIDPSLETMELYRSIIETEEPLD